MNKQKDGRQTHTLDEESHNLYYGDYLVKKKENKPDRKRQLWLLDNHPYFTGICSNCGCATRLKSSGV